MGDTLAVRIVRHLRRSRPKRRRQAARVALLMDGDTVNVALFPHCCQVKLLI